MALGPSRDIYFSDEVEIYFYNNPNPPDAKCLIKEFRKIAIQKKHNQNTRLITHIACNHIIFYSIDSNGDIMIEDLLPPYAQT